MMMTRPDAGQFIAYDGEFAAVLGETPRLVKVVNFTFGGPQGNTLYITADTAIWAATLGMDEHRA